MMKLQITQQDAQKIVDNAMQGNWIPFGVVVFLLGVIVALILRQNNERHQRNEELMKELVRIQADNSKILAVHEAEIQHLKH
jgi:hypothetical protein